MPTKSSERWIADGNNIKKQLEAEGYKVDLQYAEDDIPTQVSQIENMISSGAEALIIASIDGTTLTDVLQQAGDLAEAVQLGCKALDPEGGVLLLSPGAPSFGAYADYVARGRHFAELGGFDPATITAIAGLGIA